MTWSYRSRCSTQPRRSCSHSSTVSELRSCNRRLSNPFLRLKKKDLDYSFETPKDSLTTTHSQTCRCACAPKLATRRGHPAAAPAPQCSRWWRWPSAVPTAVWPRRCSSDASRSRFPAMISKCVCVALLLLQKSDSVEPTWTTSRSWPWACMAFAIRATCLSVSLHCCLMPPSMMVMLPGTSAIWPEMYVMVPTWVKNNVLGIEVLLFKNYTKEIFVIFGWNNSSNCSYNKKNKTKQN